MPGSVGGRNKDLEKLYQNSLLGYDGDAKRWPIPADLRREDLTQVRSTLETEVLLIGER
jgi:hypothetical protein